LFMLDVLYTIHYSVVNEPFTREQKRPLSRPLLGTRNAPLAPPCASNVSTHKLCLV